MATIGRAAAVADIRGLRLSGFTAWLLWLFVHLMYLVGFRSRLFVFLQWAWSYATFGRSVRLIVGKDEHAPPRTSIESYLWYSEPARVRNGLPLPPAGPRSLVFDRPAAFASSARRSKLNCDQPKCSA